MRVLKMVDRRSRLGDPHRYLDGSMIGFEVSVDGRFSEQHPLVQVGCALASLVFVLLGNYVPLALAVWLILLGPAHQPQPPLWAWLFVGGLLAGAVAVGWYCILELVDWFTGARLRRRQLHAIVVAISLVSATVASIAGNLGHWQSIFLGSILGVFASAILAGPITMIGEVLDGRRRLSSASDTRADRK